jgi:hypothetical protein
MFAVADDLTIESRLHPLGAVLLVNWRVLEAVADVKAVADGAETFDAKRLQILGNRQPRRFGSHFGVSTQCLEFAPVGILSELEPDRVSTFFQRALVRRSFKQELTISQAAAVRLNEPCMP